jgi:hypothetical protein
VFFQNGPVLLPEVDKQLPGDFITRRQPLGTAIEAIPLFPETGTLKE